MKRGLYDMTVRPGSMREMALLFHEVESSRRDYKEAALSGLGDRLESPQDTLDEIRDLLLPGRSGRREEEKEQKAEYIQSLQDVDWSEVFSLNEEALEEQRQREKEQEVLGDLA
jgi:hypothetical protein